MDKSSLYKQINSINKDIEELKKINEEIKKLKKINNYIDQQIIKKELELCLICKMIDKKEIQKKKSNERSIYFEYSKFFFEKYGDYLPVKSNLDKQFKIHNERRLKYNDCPDYNLYNFDDI